MSMVGSLKGIVSASVAAVRTRLALFGLEWAQARADLLRQGLQMIIGAALILMALILVTLAVVLLFWDTPYRIWVVVFTAGVYAAVGVGLLILAKRSLTADGGMPFSATIEELSRDADQLANWAQAGASRPTDSARDKGDES